MPPAAVSRKVEFLCARRIGRGLDRAAPRIGNRAGRQAVDDVGVVRCRLRDLALGEGMTERPFAEDETVDDGRVRLKLHLLLQPIGKHRGDPRALLGLAGLFLDDGGENDELVWRLERQVGIAPFPHFPDQPVLRLAHALDHLLARETAIEVIAVG